MTTTAPLTWPELEQLMSAAPTVAAAMVEMVAWAAPPLPAVTPDPAPAVGMDYIIANSPSFVTNPAPVGMDFILANSGGVPAGPPVGMDTIIANSPSFVTNPTPVGMDFILANSGHDGGGNS